MGESSRLRLTDLRKVYLLVGECCELGRDPKLWRTHFLNELRRMLGGGFSASSGLSEINPDGTSGPLLQLMDVGLDQSARRKILERMGATPFENPLVSRAFPLRSPLCTFRRQELVTDGEWYACEMFNELHGAMGADDIVGGYLRIGAVDVESVSVVRLVGDRLFNQREGSMFRLALLDVARQIGKRLASYRGQSVLDLPGRQRQVLLGLLEGDSEKQIARRLGIGQPTVHEHVKKLHERLGVSSRGELLGLFASAITAQRLHDSLAESSCTRKHGARKDLSA